MSSLNSLTNAVGHLNKSCSLSTLFCHLSTDFNILFTYYEGNTIIKYYDRLLTTESHAANSSPQIPTLGHRHSEM